MAANRKYASDGVKESVVALVQQGNSFQKVADMLNMSKTTVHRVYRKFCKRGTVETAPKTGRKKSLSDRDGRKILRQVKANRKTPLADVTDNFNNNENRNVFKKTVAFSKESELSSLKLSWKTTITIRCSGRRRAKI